MRRLLLVLLALLVLAPAAYGQDPTPTPTPTEEADDGILESDEIPPEPPTRPEAPCSDDGADGDYAYCNPCAVEGADGDYAYCPQASGGAGEPPEAPTRAAETRPLSTGQLPYTGGDPWLVGLFGLGLLLTGIGLRLDPPGDRRG